MNTFQPNDKVVCIDTTPIPISSPDTSLIDFTFPNGYIQEGSMYCVEGVVPAIGGGSALYLVGPSAVLDGIDIPWNGQRFRQVKRQRQKVRHSAKKNQPPNDVPF